MPRHDDTFRVIISAFLSAVLYVFFGYFAVRYQAWNIQLAYLGLFLIYIFWITRDWNLADTQILLRFSILMRIVLLFSVPVLSDDVYRFIWDGRLWLSDVHPFAELPSFYIENNASGLIGITPELYELINSPNYFTIYPSVCQFFFTLGAFVGGKSIYWSIVAIRLPIIVADILSIVIIGKLLHRYGFKRARALLYALNPLVILELCGNLHFEAFMILFVLLAIYFFHKNGYVLSAFFMALAIATKLIPLILLPPLLKKVGFRKAISYYLWTGLFTVLLFLPILDFELIKGMSSSLSLYFQKFEFNAGFYYLVREIGYWVTGYNIIATSGRALAILSFVSILVYSFVQKERHLPGIFLWILFIYLFFTTTVHPWYVIPLLSLSVFTKYRFSVVWSYFAFFTYFGYTREGYTEPLLLIAIEYVVVFGWIVWEMSKSDIPDARKFAWS